MSSFNYSPLDVDDNEYQAHQKNDNHLAQENRAPPISSFITEDCPSLEGESLQSDLHESLLRTDDQMQSDSVSRSDDATTSLENQGEVHFYTPDYDIDQEVTTSQRRSTVSQTTIPDRSIHSASPIVGPTPPTAFYTENIELLNLQEYDSMNSGQEARTIPKEWKPIRLSRLPAALLIFTCITMAILLECLRVIALNRQGFATDKSSLVLLFRYLPTAAVICLGFSWKSLVWDLKVITPFAVLSGSQAVKSEQSIELDYVDTLEFIAVWKSAKNRHWALFLGLVVGLLSGFLVPLATALTYIDYYSPVHQVTKIVKNTTFSYEGVLASEDGILNIPWDYRGSQPYAAVFSSAQTNGRIPPWTVNKYAFESFDVEEFAGQNATIIASVQAFNAPFECQEIRYEFIKLDRWTLISANDDDLEAANCKMGISQLKGIYVYEVTANDDLGWLNVTDCSTDHTDIRMLATAVDITSSKAIGMLCRPRYFSSEFEIQVNGSTGDIISLNGPSREPVSIDIGASLPVVVTYLDNPTDIYSQLAYVVDTQGPHPSFEIPQATFENVTIYAEEYQELDVFFKQLYTRDRHAFEYVLDSKLLETEVVDYTNSLLTQIISSFARTNVSIPIDGSVIRYESRLHVNSLSLQAMQGILVVMAIVCGLCCTILRPNTRLTEDPSSIAAVSVVLSNSEKVVEQEILRTAVFGNSSIGESSLRAWKWLLQHSRQGVSSITVEKEGSSPSSSERNVSNCQSSSISADQKPKTLEGYKPLPFRFISRVFLLLLVSSAIITLVILLHLSTKYNGFAADRFAVATAWSIVPTTLLVLLGYGIASVHAALQNFTPYLALRKTSHSRPLFSNVTSSVFMLPVHASVKFGSTALLITSLIALLFPAVKLLAAGLYVSSAPLGRMTAQVKIDKSLIDLFENMYEAFPSPASTSGNFLPKVERIKSDMVMQASQFSEWTSIPYFGLPHRSGALDNLIFANLTSIGDASGLELSDLATSITLQIPAIQVSISCRSFGPENFDTSVSCMDKGNYLFLPQCKTNICNEALSNGPSQLAWSKSDLKGGTSGRYVGSARVVGNYLYTNLSTFDTPYVLSIGEFPGLSSDFKNQTFLPSANFEAILAPGMFSPLPTDDFPYVSAVSCTKALHEIAVSATFTRSPKPALNGTKILPWSISSYNKSSIVSIREYNPATPLWAYPRNKPPSQYNDDTDSVLSGNSLFPIPARPLNIFEQIAVWQKYQSDGKVEDILKPASLATAVESVWTSYLVEMITELRTHTSVNATAENIIMVESTILSPMIRVKQNPEITIAVCVVLGLILLGLIVVFVSFPKEAFLMASPTSLAVTMGLLAGSRFLEGLREIGVRSVKDMEGWKDKKFRLGWWSVFDEGGSERWRWGIDVVEDRKMEAESQGPENSC